LAFFTNANFFIIFEILKYLFTDVNSVFKICIQRRVWQKDAFRSGLTIYYLMKFIGIIPSRYDSTRFPGKPLAIIKGKSMIQRVWEQASKSLETVVVATDSNKIFEHVQSFGGQVVMTSKLHKTGTDRCYEALKIFSDKENINYDVVINIQGDEPYISPSSIDLLKSCFLDKNTEIATLIKKEFDFEELKNPNTIKAIIDNKGFAIYFSRSIIPHIRGCKQEDWTARHIFYKHIGIYSYKTNILEQITKLEQTSLEISESLEQNRWIENGFKIKTATTTKESISIDTPEDLDKM